MFFLLKHYNWSLLIPYSPAWCPSLTESIQLSLQVILIQVWCTVAAAQCLLNLVCLFQHVRHVILFGSVDVSVPQYVPQQPSRNNMGKDFKSIKM